MSDPFSVTGSAVGVVSLGLTICQGFLAYYGPWKAYAEEIQDFTSRVDNLQTLLQVLESLISEAQDLNLSFERYQNLVLANLKTCHQACQKLKEMLQKCKADGTPTDEMKKHDWLQWKRARYPFKKDTLVSQSRAVADFQNDLSMALQILHTATIQHQQKQLQELTSRSSSIDLRTTQILTTVESRTEALIPSMKEMLKQESLIIQHGYRPILQPASLKQLVDRQVPINRRFRSRAGETSRCTCASIPWGSRSTISFFALFLHEKTCPLHQTGQKITSFGAKYTFCNRFLGLSLQVMMTIEQKAGSLSMGPSLHMRWVVADDSPAFKLLRRVEEQVGKDRKNMALYLEDARRTLFQIFANGQASPKDMLSDGSTLLHKFAAILDKNMDAQSLVVARGFVKALIDAEVPLQEQDVNGRTALDLFIWKKLVHRSLLNLWYSGDLEIPEDLFQIYSDLLTSGGLLTSPTQIIESDAASFFFDFNIMRRLIMRNMDEEYILSDVELAVHTRSEEGLLEYIASPPQPNLDMVIFMCLGWPQGMALILNSPLRLHVKSMLNPFIQACKAGDAECAVLLLEATEVITKDHLEHAGLNGHPDILDAIASRISSQRRELQNSALQQLSSREACQLGLPTEHLLDVHAFKVHDKLKAKSLAMELEPMKKVYSVYSSTWYNRNAADRLFEAGFKDLNQSDDSGRTPLMLLHFTGLNPEKNFVDTLHFAQWMVSKGADLYQKSRAGYPAIYYLVETVGSDLCMRGIFVEKGPNYLRTVRGGFWYDTRNFDSTCVELLHTILLDNIQDSCSCACSLGGCRPLTRMLRSLYRTTSREFVDAVIPGIFHCFHVVLLWGSFGDSIPIFAERVLRYVTFEKLGIKHTCHYCDHRLDNDEVEEIHDEERDNIALLEDLLVEFNRKYQELGLGIDEFLDGYWTDRMDEVLLVEPEIDPDVIRQLRELGVELSDQETTREEEAIYVRIGQVR